MPGKSSGGGTGTSLGTTAVAVCGVAALAASLISFVSVWMQIKNYRKPVLQRYVVRILFMVPIYSAASWASLMSQDAAFYLDPLRDVYEAFTIYTFLQLLINFLGGERSLIIMMHGRQPQKHLWPLDHCLPKVDISDPHTFLAIKRGILQYAYVKPILAVGTIAMKLIGVYQEGYLGASSGYLWAGIIYNLSITLSLYALALFWVCMNQDLKPFRPMPKFLCIKLIIFASYWQGFGLSILQKAGAIPSDIPGYSADNLAAAIQDALICAEMPLFAISHWYAFSWKDYADDTVSAARLPIKYALRDAFGPRDLIEDTKETFRGKNYEYRIFDSGDNVIAHEESASRYARLREGMRYERGGKGKYWIPQPNEITSRTPLLDPSAIAGSAGKMSNARPGIQRYVEDPDMEGNDLNSEDERLYQDAKGLEFGDWNYPVITVNPPASERWRQSEPPIVTTSTNRDYLQPTKASEERRASELERDLARKHRKTKGKSNQKSRAPVLDRMLSEESTSSGSVKSGRSQLVDLVVEDVGAEERERVRARAEGGSAWNVDEPRHYVRTYGDEDQETFIREGFDPRDVEPRSDSNEAAKVTDDDEDGKRQPPYDSMGESNVWERND